MSEYKKKFVLDEERIPKAWYNIVPDLPTPPAPPLNPATLQPAGPDDLSPIFPPSITPEVSPSAIEIPEETHHSAVETVALIRAGFRRSTRRRRSLAPGRQPAGSQEQHRRRAGHYNKKDEPRASLPGPAPPVGQRAAWPARCSASSAWSTWKVSYHQKYKAQRDDLGATDPSPSDDQRRLPSWPNPESLVQSARDHEAEDDVTHPGSSPGQRLTTSPASDHHQEAPAARTPTRPIW
jgi:hypothetical protein